MNSVGWLHLTDLHRGMTLQGCLWPNIEREFLQDLERLHDKCGPWDLLLWSGDMVQQGTTTEFSKFTDTLNRLYSKLRNLGSDPVLLTVPGNHDLRRPDPNSPELKRLLKWNSDPDISQEFWADRRSALRLVVRTAFRNYIAWEKAHPFPR